MSQPPADKTCDSTSEAAAFLRDRIRDELEQPLPDAIRQFAAQLAARAGGHAVAVLFYGSALRGPTADAVLDFYILVDRLRAWPGGLLQAAGNRLLPPNVGYSEAHIENTPTRAKFAVLTPRQLRQGVRPHSLDTTLWARFCQPVACAWARDARATEQVTETVVQAVVSAARWAALLGPECAAPADYWEALFRRTYAAELRVESAARPQSLLAFAPERWQALLHPAWRLSGIAWHENASGALSPRLSTRQRRRAQRAWSWRQRLGKPLNIARLVKAAFTFENGPDYLAYKVERHSGVPLGLTPWQRRHPILAAPWVLWRLKRQGVLR